jgi:branched-chain amino acid transport system permease protein
MAFVLLFPLLMTNNKYLILVACFIEIYTIAVSGLDVLFGYCGQISMGHAAFFAIGAYTSALLNNHFGVPVIVTMFIGSALGACIAAVLAYPASKLVFHFLSLVTVAFGEIIYVLISRSPGRITNDFNGLFASNVSLFGFELNSYSRFFYFGVVMVVLFLAAKTMLISSKTGRAFTAIRENTHAADGMGINVRKYKIIAFSISGFYTAFAGAMYTHLVGYINPDTFTQKQSVMFITMLLFGGTGSLLGSIVGCVTLLSINELLRSMQNYTMIVYSVLMLIVIVALPGGLYGALRDVVRRFMDRRELQKGNDSHA